MKLRSTLFIAVVFATGCSREDPANIPPSAAQQDPMESRRVVCYYESSDGVLVPVPRDLPMPESEAAAVRTLAAALIEGPAPGGFPRPFPDDAVVRGAFLLPGGTAVIDLGGETLQSGWNAGSHAELTAAYAVVQSLTANLSSVRRVQLLVGGEVVPTLAGHLDLTYPLTPRGAQRLSPPPATPPVERPAAAPPPSD